MKNKIAITAIAVFVTVLFISIVWILINQNSKLQGLVDKQNTILNNYARTDTVLNKGRIDLINAIDDFFENVPTYKDGEEVSPLNFVIYHKDVLDSLKMYKSIVSYSNENYGTNVHRIWDTDSTFYTGTSVTTRADSAQLTYKYFKDRIERNKDGGWDIYLGHTGEDYQKLLVKYNDMVDKYQDMTRQFIDLAKKHLNSNDEKTKFYEELEDAGLIKLDSTSSKDTLKIEIQR